MTGVQIEVDDGVAVLTLNEPERRNSLNAEMVSQIVEALDRFESNDEVGAVVVTGAPPAFCSGADLGNLQGQGETANAATASDGRGAAGGGREAGMRAIYEGFLRVGRSPLPTVAAVNGAAVGAGMNLALCCDVRLAGQRARFDTRFLDLGLHPGGGHTWMLRRAVGEQGTRAMVLFGEVLDGAQAEAAGLVWRCVDDDALLDEARRLATRAASMPRALSRRAKQTIQRMAGVAEHADAVDVELEAQLWSLRQPDFAERIAAMRSRISSR